MTFEEHKGALEGRRIAWFGDGNNVAVSLAQAAALLGFELALAVPEAFMLPQEVLSWAAEKPGKITICDTPQAAAEGAAALVTDCWVSMSDDPETAEKRAAAFAPYQVTGDLMALGDDAVFYTACPPIVAMRLRRM